MFLHLDGVILGLGMVSQLGCCLPPPDFRILDVVITSGTGNTLNSLHLMDAGDLFGYGYSKRLVLDMECCEQLGATGFNLHELGIDGRTLKLDHHMACPYYLA
jgi:hypothetical protein